jgi:hypothetical protein
MAFAATCAARFAGELKMQRQPRSDFSSRAGARRAELEDSGQQRVEITGVGAVVDDRRAYRELVVEQRRRRRRDSGFLNINN